MIFFLGYLNTKEVDALLAENLRQVDNDPKSRFCILKKRFRLHYELLQTEKGLGAEKVKRMIDILGTRGDYGKELMQVLEDNAGGSRSDQPSILSTFWSGLNPFVSKSSPDKHSRTTFNGYNLAQKDDTTFLTEICTITAEEPVYRPIVEEILQEAITSVSKKLKRLEKESLWLLEKEIPRIARREIDDRINEEKKNADLAAKAQLRTLIRQSLDAEADHPTNRWVFTNVPNVPELTRTNGKGVGRNS